MSGDGATMRDGAADGRDETGGTEETGPHRDPEDLPLPPRPDGLPLVGNTLGFLRGPFAFYDRLAEHGDIVRYDLAHVPFTTLLHPDHVEQVLLHDDERFGKWTGQEFADLNFAPDGLVFAEGEQWRRQRTAVQDAFTMERVRSYGTVMREEAERLVSEWDDGEVVALNEACTRLTLRVLGRTLLALDVEADVDVLREAMDAVHERTDGRNPANLLPGWVPTPSDRRYRRAVDELRTLVEERIAERRGATGEYDDLLALLLTATDEDGDGLSEAEVRDQVVTFLGAGTDTTALALTYACLEVAKRDDVGRRLEEERAAVLGGDAPDVSDLPRLEYAGRVVEETLRLYPPAYAIFRETREDVAVGGYRIPAGTIVTLPQFHLHTDERWWEAPDAFRPHRWTDGREGRPEYAYFPFGGGPRHCIGMRFARMELKHALTAITGAVDVELLSDPDPDYTFGVTLQPADDVRVRVHER